MAVLEILLYPHPVLSTKASPVAKVDDSVRALVDDMIETMYDAPGVGLAAPQIGRSLRITVIDVANPEEDEPSDLHVLINPVIVEKTGKLVWEEGCLSMPRLYREVKRAERVVVEALDRDGELQRYEATGLLAVCMQHEIDHLDGVMFVDRLSSLKKRMALKEWKRHKPKVIKDREEALNEDSEKVQEAGG